MGQHDSKTQHKMPSFLNNYHTVENIPSARTLTYLKDSHNNQFAMRKIVRKKQQLSDLMQDIAKKRCLQSENVVRLIDASASEQGSYCFEMSHNYFLINLPHKQLLKEFNRRAEANKPFAEEELWSILVSVVFGMASLQRLGIRHRSLSLDSIFITDQGDIKVSDPWLLGDPPLTDKYLNTPQPYYYIPPGWMQYKEIEEHASYKGDVLSFGVTMLSLGLLKHCPNQSPSIQIRLLPMLVEEFGRSYEKELVNLLKQMLANEEERPDWQTIQDAIRQSQEEEHNFQQQKARQQEEMFTAQPMQRRPSKQVKKAMPHSSSRIHKKHERQSNAKKQIGRKAARVTSNAKGSSVKKSTQPKATTTTGTKKRNVPQTFEYLESLQQRTPPPSQNHFMITPIAISEPDNCQHNPRQYPRASFELVSMFMPPHRPCHVKQSLTYSVTGSEGKSYNVSSIKQKDSPILNIPYMEQLIRAQSSERHPSDQVVRSIPIIPESQMQSKPQILTFKTQEFKFNNGNRVEEVQLKTRQTANMQPNIKINLFGSQHMNQLLPPHDKPQIEKQQIKVQTTDNFVKFEHPPIKVSNPHSKPPSEKSPLELFEGKAQVFENRQAQPLLHIRPHAQTQYYPHPQSTNLPNYHTKQPQLSNLQPQRQSRHPEPCQTMPISVPVQPTPIIKSLPMNPYFHPTIQPPIQPQPQSQPQPQRQQEISSQSLSYSSSSFQGRKRSVMQEKPKLAVVWQSSEQRGVVRNLSGVCEVSSDEGRSVKIRGLPMIHVKRS